MLHIRPTKFAHVVYLTRHFDQMLSCYQTVFDARVQHQNPTLAFLRRQADEPISPIRGALTG